MPQKIKRWTILHEDEDLIVLDKPSGWLSIPHRQDKTFPNLKDSLESYREEIFVVHRIDKDTSGVICFAKNAKAHQAMSQAFTERKITKHYQAITLGVPYPVQDSIDLHIAGPDSKYKMYVSKTGKHAISHYKVLKDFQQFALVELNIETGRTHQIRVHLAARGYPLLVDPMYGGRSAFFLSSLKRKHYNLKKNSEERPLLSRCPLHAARLSFEHPISGQKIEICAPIPKDMQAVLKQIEKVLPASN